MKLITSILLLIFVTFLSTPTIITLIEKNTDVSLFYNFAEEEISKELKEIKADLRHHNEFIFVDLSYISNLKIISQNNILHVSVSEEIFSPPPELI
jgi:hypothetical protein